MVNFSTQTSTIKAAHVSHDAIKPLQQIYCWEDIPRWMQCDPYIRRGYRPQLHSFSACFQSIFYLHNESVNIWSHIISALIYLSEFLLFGYSSLPDGVSFFTADNALVHTYIANCLACLIFSVRISLRENNEKTQPRLKPSQAWFHIVNAHSEPVTKHFLKLDYLGILLNVFTCDNSFIYAGLYGKPNLQAFYISLFTISATVVFSAIMSPLADGPQAAIWRLASTWPISFLGKTEQACLNLNLT